MDREKQIAGLLKVLKDSRAVTYEPNAYPIELCRHGQKEMFYVSERDGHLTIDYGVFAKDLYDAGYRKQTEGAWISVDEKLPESQQMVLGYTPCDGYVFVGFYQKVDSPYWKSYWNIITAMRSTRKITKKVTHWMPLPEPPKMKGGE